MFPGVNLLNFKFQRVKNGSMEGLLEKISACKKFSSVDSPVSRELYMWLNHGEMSFQLQPQLFST